MAKATVTEFQSHVYVNDFTVHMRFKPAMLNAE